MYMAKTQPQYSKTFIREWRKHRNLTLEQLSDRLQTMYPGLDGTTHASLGRIERGLQPYNQPLLDAIAEALGTDAPSLLIRDPGDPEGLWSIWDQARPGQRRQIVEIAKTLVKTGS